jgi:hypothetical protein
MSQADSRAQRNIPDDQTLQEQQRAAALTQKAFEARDMVLATLLGGAVSTAGERTLTADEVSTARADLGIDLAGWR